MDDRKLLNDLKMSEWIGFVVQKLAHSVRRQRSCNQSFPTITYLID